MKKLLLILSITFSSTMLSADSFKVDLLTGDTKLACEAILCLSSGTRPSECSPSLRRYFGIHHRHWSDTVNARRNFLKLCPVGTATIEDKVFADLRDNVLPNVRADECTAEYMNKNPDKKCVKENCGEHRCNCEEYEYRPRTTLPGFCNALYNHQYTNIRPKNICGATRWYTANEWFSGQIINRISKDEFYKLKNQGATNLRISQNKSKVCRRITSGFCSPYLKIEPIKKDCWVNKD